MLTLVALAAAVLVCLGLLRGRSGGYGGRMRSRRGIDGVPQVIPDNGLRTQTDTETATQATGKTVTLATPGTPVKFQTTATGTTGRYQIALPNGEILECECVPNAPPQNYDFPDVFGHQTTKIVYAVITVDGTGTIVGKVLYRPTGS